MYYYKLHFSDSSKVENLLSAYMSVSAARYDLIRAGFHQDDSSTDSFLFTNGTIDAWIEKCVYHIPALSKKALFDSAKETCDRLIRQLSLTLSRTGISASEFASLAFIDKGNLSKILSGVIYPNFKTWCRLTAALTMIDNSLHDFIYGVNEHDLPFSYGLE